MYIFSSQWRRVFGILTGLLLTYWAGNRAVHDSVSSSAALFILSLPGSAVVPAGLLNLSSQDADIIRHHVIEGLQLLLDSLQLHGFCLSLFGPAEDNISETTKPLRQRTFFPPLPSSLVLCSQFHDQHVTHTYFSAIVFVSRAFLRLFLSSMIFCSCCSCSRRVFSRLCLNTKQIKCTKMLIKYLLFILQIIAHNFNINPILRENVNFRCVVKHTKS